MSNRYEGLLVLNTKGNEDSAKDLTEKLEGEFKKDGAEIEQVQKIGHRSFTYAPGKESSGFYVNFIFKAAPTAIEKLNARFKLNADVYRQYYKKLGAAK